MDPQVQASFIPKKPLVSAVSERHSGGLLTVIAVFVFVASIIAAGGAFAYQKYLENSIASASTSLARAQAAYDPAVINDIIRLNERITQAKRIVSGHVAPSHLFSFLEANTLPSVRFTDFSYSITPAGDAAIALSGEALDFSGVALQSDAFNQNKLLHDVIFTDITVDPASGHITFKVTATVDASLIAYSATPAAASSTDTSAAPAASAAPAQAPAASSTQTDTFGNTQ